MEQAFGQDFSNVDAHLGAREALDPMGARAAAMGEKVAFSETSPSKEIVAHELAHVVQARQSGVDSAVQAKSAHSEPNHAAEVEADRVAGAVGQGEHAEVREAPGAAVQFSFWGAVAATLGLSEQESATGDEAKAEPKKGGGPKDFLASLETWTAGMTPDQVGNVYVQWLDAVLRGHPDQIAHLKQNFNITGLGSGQYRVYAFQVARDLFSKMGRNYFVSLYMQHYKNVSADTHNLLRSHLRELCAVDGAFNAWVYLTMFADDRSEAEAVSEGYQATDRIVRGGGGQEAGGGGGYQ